MAQAFSQMLLKAFDALLYFGINYRTLPEYIDQHLLEEAKELVIEEGRGRYMLWIERVSHAIEAAQRRKQFRTITTSQHKDET